MVLCGRNSISDKGWVLRVLNDEEYEILGWFDCDNDDLNDFFINNAKPHRKQLRYNNSTIIGRFNRCYSV